MLHEEMSSTYVVVVSLLINIECMAYVYIIQCTIMLT